MGKSIDSKKLKVYFRRKPFRIWHKHHNERYMDWRIYAIYEGKCAGHLTIAVQVRHSQKNINDFWFNTNKNPPVSRPIVAYQETAEEFKGRGMNGLLLVIANEIVKQRFGEPLASDGSYVQQNVTNPKFHERPALRVWEKMVEQGLAYVQKIQANGLPRFIMY